MDLSPTGGLFRIFRFDFFVTDSGALLVFRAIRDWREKFFTSGTEYMFHQDENPDSSMSVLSLIFVLVSGENSPGGKFHGQVT